MFTSVCPLAVVIALSGSFALSGLASAEVVAAEMAMQVHQPQISAYEPPNDGKPDQMEGAGGRYIEQSEAQSF